MKRLCYLLCFLIFQCILQANNVINKPIPYLTLRSQSANSVQLLLDTAASYYSSPREECYTSGLLSITPAYSHSFQQKELLRYLFGTDNQTKCGPTIAISGSRVPDRNKNDWLADYFGLPTDFKSNICVNPQVDNFLIHLNYAVEFDCCIRNLFMKICAPLVNTRHSLSFCERITNEGSLGYDEGYFTPTAVERSNLLNNFGEFVSEELTATLDGIAIEPLKYAKWVTPIYNRLSATHLSDIIFAIGWNIYQSNIAQFGINVRAVAPVGNKPQGMFLFEPIIGNGGHPELGAELNAHYLLWQNGEQDKHIGIFLNGYATHLFTARQCRVFDLKNKPFSRYMLAQRVGIPVSTFLWGNEKSGDIDGNMQPQMSFQKQVVPLANLTHLRVNVSTAVQGEASVLLQYRTKKTSIDIGYNFWKRACETIEVDTSCRHSCKILCSWALKGDAHLFGFAESTVVVNGETIMKNEAVPLSVTECNATIFSGTNNFVGSDGNNGGIDGIRPTRNPGVNNAHFARLTEDATPQTNINDRTESGEQTETSIEPVRLSIFDIDFCGSRTEGMSHSVFIHFNYAWCEHYDWAPYLGVGGSAELAHNKHNSKNNCPTDDTPCIPCSISQWSLWLKTGISF